MSLKLSYWRQTYKFIELHTTLTHSLTHSHTHTHTYILFADRMHGYQLPTYIQTVSQHRISYNTYITEHNRYKIWRDKNFIYLVMFSNPWI